MCTQHAGKCSRPARSVTSGRVGVERGVRPCRPSPRRWSPRRQRPRPRLGLRLADRAVGAQVLQLDHVARGVLDDRRLDDRGQRLPAQDLLHEVGDVVVLEHVVRELLRVLAGLLGATHEVLGELALVDAELLLLGDLVEDELRGDGVADAALELGLELLLGLALVLEVLLHGDAGVGELLLDVLATGVELVGHDRVGQRDVDLLEQLLEDGVARRGRLLEALAATEALAHVGGQLLGGVELRGHLRELVVDLGELLLLDLGDRDGNLDVLAHQVATDQLRGEGLLVARGHAEQRLVEALEHPATADLVRHAADLGTLDVLAVLGRLQVEDHEVPVSSGALHVVQRAEPATQGLDLLVDVGVGHLDVLDLGLQAVVVGERDLGLDLDLGGELEGLVVLELRDLDLGLRQRLEGVALQGLDVLLGKHVVDRLVQDRAAPDLTVDHGRGHLAAPEAGDVDLLGNLLVRRVEARLELLEGHLDGQLGPGRAQGLDGALHVGLLSVKLVWSCVGATGLEPAISCSQSRRASHYATPRQGSQTVSEEPLGADDGNRTRVASLEDWGSTIELHPRALFLGFVRVSSCHTAALPL